MVGGRQRLRGNDNQMPTGRNTTGRKGKLTRRTAFFPRGVLRESIFRLYPQKRMKVSVFVCLRGYQSDSEALYLSFCLTYLCKSFSVILCLIHLSHAQTLSWTLSAGQPCNSTPPAFVPFSCSLSFHLFQLSGEMGFFDGTETSVMVRGKRGADDIIPEKRKKVCERGEKQWGHGL